MTAAGRRRPVGEAVFGVAMPEGGRPRYAWLWARRSTRDGQQQAHLSWTAPTRPAPSTGRLTALAGRRQRNLRVRALAVCGQLLYTARDLLISCIGRTRRSTGRSSITCSCFSLRARSWIVSVQSSRWKDVLSLRLSRPSYPSFGASLTEPTS